MSPGQAMKLWLAVTIVLMAGCTPTFVTFQTSRVPFASNSNLETACHTYRTLSFIGVETPAPVLEAIEANAKEGWRVALTGVQQEGRFIYPVVCYERPSERAETCERTTSRRAPRARLTPTAVVGDTVAKPNA